MTDNGKKSHDDDNVIYLDESMLNADLHVKPPKKPSGGGKMFFVFALGVVTALFITALFSVFSLEKKPQPVIEVKKPEVEAPEKKAPEKKAPEKKAPEKKST